jgi:hypothetical protein
VLHGVSKKCVINNACGRDAVVLAVGLASDGCKFHTAVCIAGTKG